MRCSDDMINSVTLTQTTTSLQHRLTPRNLFNNVKKIFHGIIVLIIYYSCTFYFLCSNHHRISVWPLQHEPLFLSIYITVLPWKPCKKKKSWVSLREKHAAVNSAEERICPFYQLIHMNVIMGGNYICLVVCLLSVMKCRVYTTPLCFYYKNPPYHTQTHTRNHTQRERKERKEVSCQVFKISFRKNKASQIRARSLLLAVRRGEKAGQQSTKASIFLKPLFRESIYSPIFSSSYPNLRLIPFLLSSTLLCLTRPSSPVTQSCVFPLNI